MFASFQHKIHETVTRSVFLRLVESSTYRARRNEELGSTDGVATEGDCTVLCQTLGV
jgi:hypothetical protein